MSKKLIRYFVFFIVFFVAAVLLLSGVLHTIARYRVWQYDRERATTSRTLEERAAREYDAVMRDTDGGATPQETIFLYIKALEEHDIERASRYFVNDKRAETLSLLETMSPEAREDAIALSKEAAAQAGEFGSGEQSYTIHDPILFHLVRYPSGRWKIVEW